MARNRPLSSSSRNAGRHIAKPLDILDIPTAGPNSLSDEATGDTRLGLLPCAIYVGDDDAVSGGERYAERRREAGSSCIPVRLKDNPETAIRHRTRGIDGRGDLGRVVRIVVDDGDPSDLRLHLETPADSAELAEAGDCAFEIEPQLTEESENTRGVQDNVEPGMLEVYPVRPTVSRQRERRSRSQVDLGHAPCCIVTGAVSDQGGTLGKASYPRIVDTSDNRSLRASGNLSEGFFEGRDRLVVVEVVGLDVGHSECLQLEVPKGPESLVGLEQKDLAITEVSTGVEIGQFPPHNERRVATARTKRCNRHRRARTALR